MRIKKRKMEARGERPARQLQLFTDNTYNHGYTGIAAQPGAAARAATLQTTRAEAH